MFTKVTPSAMSLKSREAGSEAFVAGGASIDSMVMARRNDGGDNDGGAIARHDKRSRRTPNAGLYLYLLV